MLYFSRQTNKWSKRERERACRDTWTHLQLHVTTSLLMTPLSFLDYWIAPLHDSVVFLWEILSLLIIFPGLYQLVLDILGRNFELLWIIQQYRIKGLGASKSTSKSMKEKLSQAKYSFSMISQQCCQTASTTAQNLKHVCCARSLCSTRLYLLCKGGNK